jgi:Cys-tRNA(Pro)/Cys-tRNA(Cys) deacylase
MPKSNPPTPNPETPFTSPVTLELDAKKIHYKSFRHPGPIHSLEQAAQERGQSPDQVVRSILFRLSLGNYVMVLITGKRQISWPDLRKQFGQSRLTLASEEEVFQATGYPLGAVSPFGLSKPIPILIDESVFMHTEISIGSGVRGVTILMRAEDLSRSLENFTRGDFAQ